MDYFLFNTQLFLFVAEEYCLDIERESPYYEPVIRYLLEEAFNPKKQPKYIKESEIDDWLSSLLSETWVLICNRWFIPHKNT